MEGPDYVPKGGETPAGLSERAAGFFGYLTESLLPGHYDLHQDPATVVLFTHGAFLRSFYAHIHRVSEQSVLFWQIILYCVFMQVKTLPKEVHRRIGVVQPNTGFATFTIACGENWDVRDIQCHTFHDDSHLTQDLKMEQR